MYRVLIIDDEAHIVDWLVELFSLQSDLNIEVYHGYNGYEGLDFMKSLRIDILFLDIQMPGINGLEVAEKTQKNWPDCRIVFLTGHSNFEYIYQANKLNHVNFLLKNESDETILNTLKQAIKSLEEKKNHLSQLHSLKIKESKVNNFLEKTLVKELLSGKLINDISDFLISFEYQSQLEVSQPCYYIYAKTVSMRSINFIQENLSFSYDLGQLTRQVFLEKFRCVCVDTDATSFVWILQPIKSNEIVGMTFIKEYYDELVMTCKDILHLDAVFLLYDQSAPLSECNTIVDLFNQYMMTYPITQTFNSYGILFGQHEIELLRRHNLQILRNTDSRTYLSELKTALYQGEKELFFHNLNQLQYQCRHVNSMHFLPMVEIYQTIALMFTSYISQYGLTEKMAIKIGIYRLYYFHDFKNWSEAFDYIRQLADNVYNLMNSETLDTTQRLILTITNYINTNIQKSITLTDISLYVNYNSSYISRIFKQKMEMNITDYISEAKINKAKELITTTDLNMEQVANQIGYENPKYFFQVFKKYTGVSPREFQKTALGLS